MLLFGSAPEVLLSGRVAVSLYCDDEQSVTLRATRLSLTIAGRERDEYASVVPR